ncbi:(deoxy)nucleoside triphosphate pyrophosphohydrolase [Pedobacter sp. L105]|uniref:(deoxy)nucleoside triphosphate pyrophosphohydrolase n=1 Tax=Pedobacter sp. L105 TaxID=1641871 RepID=UPI00131AEDD3|nr:(deoxy)nucleoside triphosphate pyrophosphohydrolase [Pedobacter sp. L105]
MIDVSCALIKGQNGKILVTQRSAEMRLPLKWEFPGGKIEPGETEEACLIREIAEELNVIIKITARMPSFVHDDGRQKIRLIPFLGFILEGEIHLTEHAAYLWCSSYELLQLDWADADVPVLRHYLENL